MQTKSLIDWKITLANWLDKEGVKTMKVTWSLLIFFLLVNLKLRSWKKNEVKEHNIYNYN